MLRDGPEGQFWEDHKSSIPADHRWGSWKEENIVSFADEPDPVEYAELIRVAGRTLHRASPGSEALVGGLFGRPLQIPPNVASGDSSSALTRRAT